MKKLTTQQKKKKLRNKCDKLLQELGRTIYKKCMVCGNPISCLHHYFPKSTASALRYNWNNLIPVCQGCHFRHHNGDPTIHAKVLEIKGLDWHNNLIIIKNQYISTSLGYYENMEKILNNSLSKKDFKKLL